jgi:hypothetical protein
LKPGQIKDLQVEKLNIENGDRILSVKLNFTATGDDGDLGTAAFYDIKAMNDPAILQEFEDIEYDPDELRKLSDVDSLSQNHPLFDYLLPLNITSSSFDNFVPNQSGTPEHFLIDLTDLALQYYSICIKMRAIDLNGNKGEWSHVMVIKLSNKIKLAKNLRHYKSEMGAKLNYIKQRDRNQGSSSRESLYWKTIIFLTSKNFTINFFMYLNYFFIFEFFFLLQSNVYYYWYITMCIYSCFNSYGPF